MTSPPSTDNEVSSPAARASDALAAPIVKIASIKPTIIKYFIFILPQLNFRFYSLNFRKYNIIFTLNCIYIIRFKSNVQISFLKKGELINILFEKLNILFNDIENFIKKIYLRKMENIQKKE
jgi:hypothetical protein